jgi:hypothetical protein
MSFPVVYLGQGPIEICKELLKADDGIPIENLPFRRNCAVACGINDHLKGLTRANCNQVELAQLPSSYKSSQTNNADIIEAIRQSLETCSNPFSIGLVYDLTSSFGSSILPAISDAYPQLSIFDIAFQPIESVHGINSYHAIFNAQFSVQYSGGSMLRGLKDRAELMTPYLEDTSSISLKLLRKALAIDVALAIQFHDWAVSNCCTSTKYFDVTSSLWRNVITRKRSATSKVLTEKEYLMNPLRALTQSIRAIYLEENLSAADKLTNIYNCNIMSVKCNTELFSTKLDFHAYPQSDIDIAMRWATPNINWISSIYQDDPYQLSNRSRASKVNEKSSFLLSGYESPFAMSYISKLHHISSLLLWKRAYLHR